MKNKILLLFAVVLVIGLLTVSKQNDDVPEDNSLSSGNSIIWGNMVKFNNYENVLHYSYNREKKNMKRETTLGEKSFYFWDEIDFFGDLEEYPQGLCLTEKYVFISSYSGVRDEVGKIKIFDRDTGEYLLALGMDEMSHLGGLTFDGKNVWVCNSSKMSIERISYAFVEHMIKENRGQLIDIRNMVDIYRVKNIPSCITYFDGQLFIATHSIWTNATMVSYHYNDERNHLNAIGTFWVPPKVQGVTFSEKGEVYLSTSYGRKHSSYIRKYVSVDIMSKNVESYMESIELPPCSEEIVFENNKLYVLFESAGKKYLEGTDGKGKSISPLNRILVIENKKDPLYR